MDGHSIDVLTVKQMDFGWIPTLGRALPDLEFLLATFLLSLRTGALLLLTPMFLAAALPGLVRISIVLALSAALALGARAVEPSAELMSNPGALMQAALAELVLGGTLGLGVSIASAAISMAGRLIDVQIGFGLAQILDPATHRQIPIVSAAFNQLGALVFLLINGHHAVIRGLAYTVARFPPGRGWSMAATAPMVVNEIASIFLLGFALAAPVVVCLLMVELALGVAARSLPQLNMLVIGIPIKIVVGLATLTSWFNGLGDAMSRIYASIFRSWETAFAVAR